jgi:hypothetical protein
MKKKKTLAQRRTEFAKRQKQYGLIGRNNKFSSIQDAKNYYDFMMYEGKYKR